MQVILLVVAESSSPVSCGLCWDYDLYEDYEAGFLFFLTAPADNLVSVFDYSTITW